MRAIAWIVQIDVKKMLASHATISCAGSVNVSSLYANKGCSISSAEDIDVGPSHGDLDAVSSGSGITGVCSNLVAVLVFNSIMAVL